MNAQKYTQKSLEAVQNAQSIATEYGNQQIEQPHLLLALLLDEGGLIPQLLGNMGLTVPSFTAAAKAEVGKPFPFEDDLRVKSARLAELDVLLNMDGRSRPAPETMLAKSSRPSVLEGLKRPVPRNPEKKLKHHEQEVR